MVFSETEEQHAKHLQVMLEICEKNGLVLSANKMKIATKEVEFLGAVICDRKIRLQPHIIKKIADFNEDSLKEKKGLRSWLGILNYARTYIPKLGTLLGPLYEKTSPHGDKRMKPSDWEIVRKIKAQVQNLPDMEIPPEKAYIVIETDSSMEGWGAVCKWKPGKSDSRSTERPCAYASGKFPTVKSTIDAEIFAVMEGLKNFKIYYLDRGAVTIRTDCQAIISFYNKSAQNKPSRVRWLGFLDFITGSGVDVTFEHVEGKNNMLADALSRLTSNLCYAECQEHQKEELADQVEKALNELSAGREAGFDTTKPTMASDVDLDGRTIYEFERAHSQLHVYPRTAARELEIRRDLCRLYEEQLERTKDSLATLLSMANLNLVRIQREKTKDNWASDCEPSEISKVQKLEQAYEEISKTKPFT